jgi:uncharacterized protein involved in exopolysaccharide biosynthesis/Mrp family chromosome partitioning ATPase
MSEGVDISARSNGVEGGPVYLDPTIRQVREFVEESEPRPFNPVVFAIRALRGRVLLTAALSAILAVCFAIAGYMVTSPEYAAHGLIRVAAKETKVLFADSDDARLRLYDAFVSAELTFLTSRPVLETALQKFASGEVDVANYPADVTDLRDTVRVLRDKSLITISALSRDPKIAATIANAVLDSYDELHKAQNNRRESIRTKSLEDRELELLDRLEALRVRFLDVGGEYGIDSMAKAHLSKVTQLEELEQRITELDATIAQLETVGTSVDGDTGDLEIKRATLLDRAMADMTYDRAVRAAKLETLKQRYRRDHPKVANIVAELQVIDEAIEARRQQIATLGKTGALTASNGKNDEESAGELKVLLEKLQARREEVRNETRLLNGKLIELRFVGEEREELKDMLEETRRALEVVRVESKTELPGTIEIVTRAHVPDRPVSDKRPKLALIGIMAGLLAGLGGVLLLGFLDRKCRYSDDIEELLPSTDLVGVLPDKMAEPDGYTRAIREIRNALQIAPLQSEGGKVILVVGTVQASGSTETGLAMATAFAEQRFSVVAVDGDFEADDLSSKLDLEQRPGLREALLGENLTLSPTPAGLENYSALSSGCDMAVTDAGVSLAKLKPVIEQLRQEFEIIVIDAGSITDRLSASQMAALADDILLIAPEGGVARDVRRSFEMLNKTAPGRTRVVFNFAGKNDPHLQQTLKPRSTMRKAA